MGERARANNTSLETGLPRCRPALGIAVALSAVLTGLASFDAAHAQSSVSGLYDPAPTIATNEAPSFSRDGGNRTEPTRQFRQVLSNGNAPSTGAGRTGFVSTAPPPPPPSAATAADAAPAAEATPVTDAASTALSLQSLATETDVDVVGTTQPPPRRRRSKKEDDPYEPLGLRLGSFVVKPAVELTGGYDSNPERSNNARGSAVFMVAPELQIRSDWSRHEFRADVNGRYTTYPGFDATPTLNRPYIDTKATARIDVTRRTKINVEGRFQLTTEDPNSPNLPAGIAELPIKMSGGGTAGISQLFNRFEIGASGSFDRTTYGNSVLTDGTSFSNVDRNYNQYGMKLRGSYELVPGIKPFVEVGGDRRVHDTLVDASGVDRDSTGSEVRVGSTFELTKKLTGTVSVGYATRAYADPTLTDPHTPIIDSALIWTATPLSTVTFTAKSQIEESTLSGVSSVVQRDFGAQVDHSFRRWLVGSLKFGYGLDDYVGSTRVDQRFTLSGALTYKMSRNMQLKGEIRRQWLNSNVASADYVANIFLLGLRLQQ